MIPAQESSRRYGAGRYVVWSDIPNNRQLRWLEEDGHVSVFEYATVGDAGRDAALVSADGSRIGLTMVLWIGPPRFYKTDRIIVLSVGNGADVIGPLDAVLGAPFVAR